MIHTVHPEFIKMIADAAKAPSGHNTQPWKFSIEANRIILEPDFSRRLAVVDADDHALYISLGCALENLILSAKAHEFSPTVSFNFQNGKDNISVDLIKSSGEKKDLLYDYINSRQSTRNEYSQQSIEQSKLNQLKSQAVQDSVEVLFFTNKEQINQLASFIIEGSNRQFSNRHFVNELVSWFRFSKQTAQEKGDGIWTSSMGLPAMPGFIGNIVMKHFVSAGSEAKRWRKLIDKTAGFALFIAQENTKTNWITLGQSFQRFGLKATELNIMHAHVNMPCEEIEVRKKMIEQYQLGTRQPLLLIRFGYSGKMPCSFRRNTESVIAQVFV